MKYSFRFVLLWLIVSMPAWSQPEDSAPAPLPRVLYINSYHLGYSWSDSLAEGILSTLEGKAAVYTEYLDGKRSDYEDYEAILQKVIALKYSDMDIEAVVTSDDSAFRFVKEHRDSLFKDLPVVACGINYMTPEMIVESPGTTGVMEGGHPLDTARLAMGLFPETRQIIFISDYEYGDRADAPIASIREALGPGISYLRIQQQPDTTLQEVIAQLNAADKASVVLFFGLTFDPRTGEEAYVMEQLVAVGLPIFVFDKRFVHYGALGGIVQDGNRQGVTAAEMVLQLLKGKPVEQVTPVFEPIDERVFDYAQLKQFGLFSNPLLADATLIGAPDRLIARYRKYLLGGVIFIGIQSVWIAVLVRTNQIRRRTAIELEAAKNKAEIALQAKTEFLMMVSHELRTPLNAIDGFSELLTDEEDASVRIEYIQHIQDSSKCQLGIINDILEFTNANKQAHEIDTEICDVTGNLRELVSSYHPAAATKRLELDFHTECGGGLFPYLNWDYLQLAVSKLIENAIKFSRNGQIKVVLAELHQSDKHAITIAVTDQGQGIDEKRLAELLEVFGRADTSITREHSGMGLGLALCHRVTTAMGGTLQCRSKPDEETEFKIVLPVR